jgi:hypothetical protein
VQRREFDRHIGRDKGVTHFAFGDTFPGPQHGNVSINEQVASSSTSCKQVVICTGQDTLSAHLRNVCGTVAQGTRPGTRSGWHRHRRTTGSQQLNQDLVV